VSVLYTGNASKVVYQPRQVILCDPPWRFTVYKEGSPKLPQAQYKCMSLEDLIEYRGMFEHLLADDCVLVMWTTWPMLAAGQAHKVMEGWGFTPKTGGSWQKTTKHGKMGFGTGYIYRGSTEPWLLGTRGHPKVKSKSVRNGIIAPLREHSRKPDQMHQDLEKLFAGPFMELFARSYRPGWLCIGDEVGKFPMAA
jgi:N6-adenosine-specific RNA methylase IME4